RSSAIVQSLERLTGLPAGTVSFATEAPFLNALGIETVICGPADIAQAHQPDEYVDGARLLSMQSIITALIAEYCLGS
ncbi:MAG: acetylornithine deacetylase, partial [Gammaproteobacteria bacterium]